MGVVQDLGVQLMFQRALPAVLEVERSRPGRRWAREDFLPAFDDPIAEGWVAEVDGRVVGHLVFRREGEGLALLNLAVAPHWRRQGVARAMLGMLEEKRPARIRATVPESKLAAQLLLRKAGFRAVGVLHGCFDEEDGYVMQRLPGSP